MRHNMEHPPIGSATRSSKCVARRGFRCTSTSASDAGRPVVAIAPDRPHTKIYREIAAGVRDQLGGGRAVGRAAPKIVIEA